MADPRANVEQIARNIGLAQDLLVDGIANLDPGLWRGARLLVPIHLNALVVNPEDAERTWADVKLNPHAIPGYDDPDDPTPDGEQKQPGPFDEFKGREAGIHLHWTLPDGLTKGEQISDVAEEAPPEEVARPDEDARWLVVRIESSKRADRRRARAWIIESEEVDPAKRVTKLAVWNEDRSANTSDRWMTVLGKGDPAFAAYYDNVKNVLGFYDNLDDVETGPLTYVVTGWYSKKEDDPLFEPPTKQMWLDKLDFLGWSLGTDDEEAARLAELEKRARADQDTIGLNPFDRSEQFSVVDPNTGLLAPGPQSAIAAIASKSDVFLSPSYLFKQYWPRQLLCHAAAYDIPWGGAGGTFDSAKAGPPQPGSVKVSVGNTGAEAIGALIAKRRDFPNLERILTAFHQGALAQIQDPDGLPILETLLHADTFLHRHDRAG